MLSGIQVLQDSVQYLANQFSKMIWGDSNYQLDLSRIGFIWFSDNPDEFMPSLNKFRLIQNRIRNPNAKFYLVYSSQCLSPQAHQALEEFSKQIDITLIDFDTHLFQAQKTPVDNDIYHIASSEIFHTRKNSGGSLASASDCVRLLEPLLEICANYIDLDIDFDLSNMPKLLPVKAPIIFPSRTIQIEQIKVPSITNSFMGVSVIADDISQIHPKAKEKLNSVKAKIVENYQYPSADIFLTEFAGFPSILGSNPFVARLVRKLFEKKCDIFQYRQLISAIPDENLRQQLYKESVMKSSGPFTWYHLYDETVKLLQASSEFKEFIPVLLEELLTELENASELHNGLQDCFLQNNNPEQNVQGQFKSDVSWTPYGKEKLHVKSKIIDEGAIVLQSACRKLLATSELENLRKRRLL